MRNLKRALSLVMAMALIVGMMVISASAASKDFTDAGEIDHTEAVNTMVALNVISGKDDGSYFDPEGTLTRSEMAKVVAFVMNGGVEPNIGTKVIPTYSDIDNHWAEAYIEYCTSMGIIAGDGQGKFNPTGELTASQTAKMFLTAMGYDATVFGLVGADWETNTNRFANEAGLYENLGDIRVSDPISRDDACQMAYNAIQAALMVRGWSQDVTTGNITERYELAVNDDGVPTRTLLSERFGGKIFIGTFVGNSNSISSLRDGEIRVNGLLTTDSTFDDDGNVRSSRNGNFPADLDISYIGEEVKVLFKDGTSGTDNTPDRNDTIYGVFVTGSTQVLNVTAGDITSAANYTTPGKIEVGGVAYEVAAPSNGQILVVRDYGAGAYTISRDTALSTSKAAFDGLSAATGDTVKFIFNEADQIEMAYLQTYHLSTVTAVNSERVTIRGLGSIVIADNDVYDGIARDDVVVYTKLYDATTADAYVTVTKAEVVSGTVNGFRNTSAGNPDTVTLDGTVYKIYGQQAMQANVAGESGTTAFQTEHIGETFDLYLVNGYVAAAIQTSESASNYSVVVDKDTSSVEAGDSWSPLRIVVLGADGVKTTLTVDEDSDIDGNPATTHASITHADFSLGDIVTWTGSASSAMVTIEAHHDAHDIADGGTIYDSTAKTVNGIVTSTNAVLYVTNSTGAYKAYNIRDLKDVENNTGAAIDYTYVVKNDRVVAVFAPIATTPAGATSSAVLGIVTANNGTVKSGDDYYSEYVIASDTETYTVRVKTGSLTKGDVYGFAPSADGLYDNAATSFTCLTDGASSPVSIDGTTYNRVVGYVREYDESDRLLTYYTSVNRPDGDEYVGNGALTTKAMADDATILYVDVDGDVIGDEIGINPFDGVTGYANVVLLIDQDDDVITHVIVETSGEANVFD